MVGIVIDATTREGIPFAVLNTTRNGRTPGVETDVDGTWSFDFLPGEMVRAAHTSYKPVEVSASALADNGGIIAMEPRQTELSEVVVRPHQQPGGGLWWLLLLAALASGR